MFINVVIFTSILIVIYIMVMDGREKINCKYVDSSYDNSSFCVMNGQKASDKISELNANTLVFFGEMKRKYTDPNESYIVNGIKIYPYTLFRNILRNYNQDNIIEVNPKKNSTSYTIDKGSVLAICIGDDGDGENDESLNTLTFVMLHEITHLGVKSYDHTPDFWASFRFILDNSSSIYEEVDYSKNPVTYCGYKIEANP